MEESFDIMTARQARQEHIQKIMGDESIPKAIRTEWAYNTDMHLVAWKLKPGDEGNFNYPRDILAKLRQYVPDPPPGLTVVALNADEKFNFLNFFTYIRKRIITHWLAIKEKFVAYHQTTLLYSQTSCGTYGYVRTSNGGLADLLHVSLTFPNYKETIDDVYYISATEEC